MNCNLCNSYQVIISSHRHSTLTQYILDKFFRPYTKRISTVSSIRSSETYGEILNNNLIVSNYLDFLQMKVFISF